MILQSDCRAREKIVVHGESLHARGFVPGSSGNISVRVDDGILVTPTNSCMGRLDPAKISKVDEKGRHVSGDPPSKEAFLHILMYGKRASTEAIVHLHSTHAVAVSCCSDLSPDQPIPPLTAYYAMKIGRLKLLPYYPPGDERLARAVEAVADKYRAILLANHGPVVAGTCIDAAVYAIEELEEAAKLYLLLQGEGRNVNVLTSEQIADLEVRFPS